MKRRRRKEKKGKKEEKKPHKHNIILRPSEYFYHKYPLFTTLQPLLSGSSHFKIF